MIRYFYGIIVALDFLGNAFFGGSPYESISSRLGREYPNSFLAQVVDFIFWKNHCKDSVKKEK